MRTVAGVMTLLLLGIAPTAEPQEITSMHPASALPRLLVAHGPLDVLPPGLVDGDSARRLPPWAASVHGTRDPRWDDSNVEPAARGAMPVCRRFGCSKRATYGPRRSEKKGGCLRMFCAEHRTKQTSVDLNRKRCKHAEGCDNFAYYTVASLPSIDATMVPAENLRGGFNLTTAPAAAGEGAPATDCHLITVV